MSAEGPNTELLFQVFVDDNFHYMDSTERYRLGAFPDCETAILACQRIVDAYLQSAHEPGMATEELWDSYITFGEEPYIVAPEDATCSFSDWDYARSRCELLCG